MAKPKLFQLKSEVAPHASGPKALHHPIARVRVDTGVFHLDGLYDYLIPENLSALIGVGFRVQIPFGSSETEGIVVERVETAQRSGELKMISKVLGIFPVATTASLNLFDQVARHYGCNPWDVIRSAIPSRVIAVEKRLSPQQPAPQQLSSSGKGLGVAEFRMFEPFVESFRQVQSVISDESDSGSVLVIAPDERDVDRIISALKNSGRTVLKLTSAMPRSERYLNFLRSCQETNLIVVGTRSAIFLPLRDLSQIIIFKESSFDHFEARTPGWNSTTVAQMRVKNEKANLVLMGYCPSIAVANKIDEKEIKFVNNRHVIEVKAFTPQDGALLPGRIFTDIRKALSIGPVLFIAPRKGYGNALLCGHCKNVASCSCGGRLSIAAKGAAPTCVHCGDSFPNWRCNFCHHEKQYLGSRGIDRAAEELARAFPNHPVIISAGEVIKEEVEAKPCLVLSTPGAEPLVDKGYAAVVILDGLRFFSHTDIRSQERARELFLESASLISGEGVVLLIIDDVHPITSTIARWNIAPLIKRELAERKELALPPFVASAILVMEQSIALSISNGLQKALGEGRVPPSTKIYGPSPIDKNRAKIVLHTDPAEAQALVDVLHELQRRRSMAKKEVFMIRVDPYSL